jgi:hypothetical protein
VKVAAEAECGAGDRFGTVCTGQEERAEAIASMRGSAGREERAGGAIVPASLLPALIAQGFPKAGRVEGDWREP